MAYSHWDNFLINCTQMFGSIWFGLVLGEDIAADEATSAFVWRKQKKGWIRFVNWLMRDPQHCANAYWAEKTAAQQAPDYRAKFDEESE